MTKPRGRKPAHEIPEQPAAPPVDESDASGHAAPGRPSFEDITSALHLTEDASLHAAYAAECSAQRSVCHLPPDGEPWPDELRTALIRRIEVAHANGRPRSGSTDPQVRDLEDPYSKRRPPAEAGSPTTREA